MSRRRWAWPAWRSGVAATTRRFLPAADCGVAFQLTNILRDLQEDGRQGRVYLPHDELARFGVAPIDWLGAGGH